MAIAAKQAALDAPLASVVFRIDALSILQKLLAGRRGRLVLFAALWLEALILQWFCGAFSSDFAGHPDEAAHFVSALMVSDFLRSPIQNPVEFAQSFAEHYPKVAIGNWPPVLYLLLGTWLMVFGASRIAAMAFVALAAAATAMLIFLAARRYASCWISAISAGVYLAIPLVQTSSNRVMTEHFVTAFLLAATLSLAEYLRSPSTLQAFRFAALAILALLTRGSAWALLLMVPIAFCQPAYWATLKRWSIWIASALVFVVCVPWYVFASRLSRGAMEGYGGSTFGQYVVDALGFYLRMLWAETPLLMFTGAIGFILVMRRFRDPQALALLGVVVGILVIHSAVPASKEQRFLVQALPAFVVFTAALAQWIHSQIGVVSELAWPRSIVSVAIAGSLCAVSLLMGAARQPVSSYGYGRAADFTLALSPVTSSATLIVSDSIGEGAFIAAIAEADQRPNHVVVRGSKALIREDWVGRPLDDGGPPTDIPSVLRRAAVQTVLLDSAINPLQRRSYHREMAIYLAANSSEWMQVATFQVRRYGQEYPSALALYRRASAIGTTELTMNESNRPLISGR